MAVLSWSGKKEAIENMKNIPYRQIEISDKENINSLKSENIIINGNYLDVLKSLLPIYRNEIKCIYMEPPYLKSYRSIDDKKIEKDDNWLNMIYQRLMLGKDLMSEDSIMFISLGDEEIPMIRIIMDNLFGRKNMLACFIWQTDSTLEKKGNIKINHKYILAYAKDIDMIKRLPVIDPSTPKTSKVFKKYIENTLVKNGEKNPKSEVKIPAGFPVNIESGVIDKETYRKKKRWPIYSEDLIIKNYKLQNDVAAYTGWSSKDQLLEFIKGGFKTIIDKKGQETRFEIRESGAIYSVKKRAGNYSHVVSVLREEGIVQTNIKSTKPLKKDIDNQNPVDLIKYLISMIDSNEFTVLDMFPRQGNTVEAILKLNKEDICKNINFILINPDEEKGIIEKIKSIEKTIGTERFYRIANLGKSIIDESNKINKEIGYMDLAYYIFFNEMQIPMKASIIERPFIYKSKEKSIVLLYNGQDDFDKIDECLDMKMLRSLIRKVSDGCNIIIYGKSCIIEHEDLYKNNITFKQIPYDIKLK